MNDNFRWKTQFNFATNKNKIVSLGGTPNFQYASGNVSMPYKMMVVEGGSLGDIYGNVFVRDANGKILLEARTLPKLIHSGRLRVLLRIHERPTDG